MRSSLIGFFFNFFAIAISQARTILSPTDKFKHESASTESRLRVFETFESQSEFLSYSYHLRVSLLNQ